MRILLALLLLTSPAFAITQWNKAIPASGDSKSAWPAAVTAQWSVMDSLLANYRQGMALIYKNSTTLTVNAGEITASNSGATIRLMLQNASNTDITSANLDSGGSFSAGTTYYVYAGTSSSAASSATYYISTGASAPSGVTYYKRLGSFSTDGSANIIYAIVNDNFIYSAQLGTAVSKSSDTAYQATTDGFFYGNIYCDGTGLLSINSDANASPSTTLETTGCSSSTTSGYYAFSIPVKKGDYYKAVSSGSHVFSTTMFFSPQGS